MKTTDLQTALYNATGRTAMLNGHKYKLQADFRQVIFPYKREEFHCVAEDLTPQNDHERKFCLWDLWNSESDEAAKLMLRFARMGGYSINANQ